MSEKDNKNKNSSFSYADNSSLKAYANALSAVSMVAESAARYRAAPEESGEKARRRTSPEELRLFSFNLRLLMSGYSGKPSTPTVLGAAIGKDKNIIEEYSRGSYLPRDEVLDRIADFFDIDPERLRHESLLAPPPSGRGVLVPVYTEFPEGKKRDENVGLYLASSIGGFGYLADAATPTVYFLSGGRRDGAPSLFWTDRQGLMKGNYFHGKGYALQNGTFVPEGRGTVHIGIIKGILIMDAIPSNMVPRDRETEIAN